MTAIESIHAATTRTFTELSLIESREASIVFLKIGPEQCRIHVKDFHFLLTTPKQLNWLIDLSAIENDSSEYLDLVTDCANEARQSGGRVIVVAEHVAFIERLQSAHPKVDVMLVKRLDRGLEQLAPELQEVASMKASRVAAQNRREHFRSFVFDAAIPLLFLGVAYFLVRQGFTIGTGIGVVAAIGFLSVLLGCGKRNWPRPSHSSWVRTISMIRECLSNEALPGKEAA